MRFTDATGTGLIRQQHGRIHAADDHCPGPALSSMTSTRRLGQRRFMAMCLIACAAVLARPASGRADVTRGDVSAPVSGQELSLPTLSVAVVEGRVAQLEAASGIEDVVMETLRTTYGKAIEHLLSAEESRRKTATYRDAIKSAPHDVADLRRQLEALVDAGQSTVPAVAVATIEALQEEVESRRAGLADVEGAFRFVTEALNRTKGRPVEIGSRLPLARNELSEISSRLAAPEAGGDSSPGRMADRALLEARQAALAAEIQMLGQEQLSQAARENRLMARRDLLALQRETERGTLTALEDQLRETYVRDAQQLAARVDQIVAQISGGDEDVDALLAELPELTEELLAATKLLEDVDLGQKSLTKKLDELNDEFTRIREEVRLGGLEGSFAQVLMEQRLRLPNPLPLTYSIKARSETLRDYRLAGFRAEQKLRVQEEMKRQLEERPGADLVRLRATRAKLLEELRSTYQALVREVARVDADERAYRDLILKVQDYLYDRLFWVRSSPTLGLDSIKDIPAGLAWALGIRRWYEGAVALAAIPPRHPMPTLVVSLAVALLLVRRPRIKTSLEESGRSIRSVSTDRYSHTLRALRDTLLLAAPVPLALGLIAFGLLRDPAASEWVRGFGYGLAWTSTFLVGALAVRENCRPGGLGIVHFGWSERSATLLRSVLLRMLAVYVPASLLIGTTLYESSSIHFDSFGRLSFSLAHIWIALEFRNLLRPSDGLFAAEAEAHSYSITFRCQSVLYCLAVGLPLALVALAWFGFAITAMVFSLVLQVTLGLMAAGAVVYGLVLRWFLIKERSLAMAEAMAERQVRQDAAEKSDEPSGQEIAAEEESLELDLAAVGAQTRRLLRSLIGVGVVVMIWLLWSGTLPLDQLFDDQSDRTGISLFNWLQATFVIGVAISVLRNLPGLLDLAGLRNSDLDPGTRYAVATICQYIGGAITFVMVFRILQLDWSRFGWIAAALSVGLGFGLQEIVANLICGIILLFERPIRVGDVVTIGPVTGTVTRIRMRATTITNWDRQEFVVPNKEFVTGSLINWTLSNPINRVVLKVGVAYGSDTVRARELLLNIAGDHPVVLADPAPVASFEAFGDSALDLLLRCYLPDMDNRLKTISELHAQVDHRFKEAGIEIAFPQRDVHLRSGLDTLAPHRPDGGPGEEPSGN